VRVTGESVERIGRNRIATGLRETRAARHTVAEAAESLRSIRFRRGRVGFSLKGQARQFDALNSAPAGAQVYVIRDAGQRIVYVGYTERGSVTRLGEHLADKAGEFIGDASSIEVKGVGLLEREARALEEDLIQELRPKWNRELDPYARKYGAPPHPDDVRRAQNASIRLDIIVGE